MARRIEDDRPLTWGSLTGPSRVMVPYYIAASAWASVVYLFDPQGRVGKSAGLTVARLVVHDQMWLWGIVFGALAIGLVIPFATCERAHLGLGLYAGVAILAMWTGFTIAAVFLNPAASLTAPMWLSGIALASFASGRSVLTREAA